MSQIPTIIDSIPQYNEHLGLETIHPLVSVIDLSKAKSMRHQRTVFNFYVIFLKDVKCGDIIYGRQRYDYQEGTVVSCSRTGNRHRRQWTNIPASRMGTVF